MSDKPSLAELTLQFLAALGLVFFGPVVIRDLWNWFVVPQFGLMRLTYAMAMGLGALKTLLSYRYNKDKADGDVVMAGWGLYLTCWLLGGIFK